MKKHILKFATLSILSIICSCSNQKNDTPVAKDTTQKSGPMQMQYTEPNKAERNGVVDSMIPAVEKKYDLSSGIITMELEIAGNKSPMNTTIYFDHYGNRECTETISMNTGTGNQPTHKLSFNSDGYLYGVDLIAKTATKKKYNPKAMTGGFSFAGMTENVKKQYNVKKIGTGVILGKECDKYSMSSGDMKGEFYVWKNLTLSLNSVTGGLSAKVTATKLEENVPIPKDKFTVPSDVKITVQ